MNRELEMLKAVSIDPARVRRNVLATSRRMFGVYEVSGPPGTRRFRVGIHPERRQKLQVEFGKVALHYLFRNRADAVNAAGLLNELSER